MSTILNSQARTLHYSVLLSGLLVLAGIGSGAHAAGSAAAPTLDGTKVTANGTISGSEIKGVQGGGSSAGARLSYKGFGAKASKSKSSDSLGASASAGTVTVEGKARLSGSEIIANGTLINASVVGAEATAGAIQIGPAQ